MATILWGKPALTITVVSSTNASANLTVPTPVEDSTQLSTERGDKHEANIEGGGYEAVRYDKGSFTLEFSVRFATGRTMPFADVSHDGITTGTYKFVVSDPADNTAPKMQMNEAVVSYEDEYSADNGAMRHYFCESIIPESGDQITWVTTGQSQGQSHT